MLWYRDAHQISCLSVHHECYPNERAHDAWKMRTLSDECYLSERVLGALKMRIPNDVFHQNKRHQGELASRSRLLSAKTKAFFVDLEV